MRQLYIAFLWSFKYLLRDKTDYEQGLHGMLMQGGDTDANAAVMGGLLGAKEGKTNIKS